VADRVDRNVDSFDADERRYMGLILVLYAIVAAFVNLCEKLLAAATDRSRSTAVTTGYSNDGTGDAER
jgi:hypothetical protein